MNYYAIQVRTRLEEKYINLFRSRNPDISLPIHFPRRYLDIRKNGKVRPSTPAVFPGYIFIEAESDEEILAVKWKFRRTDGFMRFLKTNKEITALGSKDLEIVLHFINNPGSIAGKSKVYFTENARIIVAEGPLSGLEGKIVKVDRRKRRAKIKLDLYNDSFTIDLAFEVIEAKPETKG